MFSKSSNSNMEDSGDDGGGVIGVAGATTEARDDAVDGVGDGRDKEGGAGMLRGRPEAARALTTASQPFSNVRILSFSSSFSCSRALSPASCSAWLSMTAGTLPMPVLVPARNCLFSSSSSATRRSRYENCAFRRSREFCAAMRLRCARASLRSSVVISERERLRGGQSEEEDEGAGEGGESMDSGEAGMCSTTKAASTERFMVVLEYVGYALAIRGREEDEGGGRGLVGKEGLRCDVGDEGKAQGDAGRHVFDTSQGVYPLAPVWYVSAGICRAAQKTSRRQL